MPSKTKMNATIQTLRDALAIVKAQRDSARQKTVEQSALIWKLKRGVWYRRLWRWLRRGK